MAKKVFAMYLAKEGNPNSDAYAKLDLPASPWELWDALEKVRLQTDDILYMEIEDYFAFEYLSPHLDGLETTRSTICSSAWRANLKNMQRICGGDPAGKMHRLLDYTDRPGDVADPWYTGDFEATWRDVSEGCKCLLAEIEKSGI